MQLKDGTFKWIDKCRCGRTIHVTVGQQAGRATVHKDWHDKEGKYQRTTGDTQTENVENESNSSLDVGI